jgi:hypothetical protein
MQNDAYKNVVGSMAKVLQGDMSIDALDGAIIAIDSQKASEKLKEAAKETDELGDTPASVMQSKEPVKLGEAKTVDEIKALDELAMGGK